MKAMKTLLAAALCVSVCMSLTACGNNNGSSSQTASQTQISQDSSSIPDESSENDSSESESSQPKDDSSETQTEMTPDKEVCTAFLQAISDGDIEYAASLCDETADKDSLSALPVNFKFEISGDGEMFRNADNDEIELLTCKYSPDGKIKSRPLYVVLLANGNEFTVLGAVFDEYPTELLAKYGIEDQTGNDVPTEESLPLDELAVLAGDIIADAKNNGADIGDGVYKFGDGSMLSSAIDANLGWQELDVSDYEITVSGGKVTAVSAKGQDGTQAEKTFD